MVFDHSMSCSSFRGWPPVSSLPMAISLASALPAPLPRAPQKLLQHPNRRLLRKQSAAKLPMRPGKSDRIPASRAALGDRCAQTAFELTGVEFIDENGGGPGVRLRKPPKEKPRN
jgi:hypothetical protein